jgi:sugar/nucleoside kinase (ribokinase family)
VAGGFPMMTSRALEIASNNGMIFSFDPGHAADAVDFSKILPGTDLLFANQYELKKYFKINLSEKALKTFAKGFPGMVIVKTGSKGAIATDGFEYHTSDIFEVPVVDTVGAGDAFAAGFLTAWTRSERIEQALHFANAVAALQITKSGAQTGPTLDQTASLLAKHGVSIEPILRSFRKGKAKGRYRRN